MIVYVKKNPDLAFADQLMSNEGNNSVLVHSQIPGISIWTQDALVKNLVLEFWNKMQPKCPT